MKSYIDLKRSLQMAFGVVFIGIICSFTPVNAQTKVRGSISSHGSGRVVVYGQPSMDLNNTLFENINICISTPDLGQGNPKVSISHNYLPSLEWMAVGEIPYIANGRAYYTFIGNDTSAMLNNWMASSNNPIVELSFDDGVGAEYVQLNDLTDAGGIGSGGGSSGQSFWYVQANVLGDLTDYDFKFYQNAGSKLPLIGGTNAPSSVETADSITLPVNPLLENAIWQLFPNPVAGPLHLVSGVSETVYLQIFDPLGRLMWEQKTTLSLSEIFNIYAAGSLPGGLYMLKISAIDGQQLFEAPFIVMKE